MYGEPLPNMIPNPMIQKNAVVTAKTMKFFDKMLTQFLARQNPDSTQAKPRFMKNTSIAVINTQTVSIPTLRSATNCAVGSAAVSTTVASSTSCASAGSVAS